MRRTISTFSCDTARPVSRSTKHLSKSSKALYRQLAEDYELTKEPHALEVLRLALEALDRCEEARRAIAQHGATYVDRYGQPKARPEVGIERDSRIAAMRAFRELSLDGATPDEVRLPRVNGAMN
jgi:terminase small subunit-like protein